MGAWRHFRNSMSVLAAHPVAAATPLRSFGRYFAWQWRSRLTAPPHRVPFVDGTRVEVERSGGSGLAAFLPLHEFTEMGFMLLTLRPGDRFVDVGANVGLHTVLAAACGAQVVALEPLPAARAMLERNLAANGLSDRVRVMAAGAAAQAGELVFTDGSSCLNHVVAEGETPSTPTRRVPVVRVDAVAPPGPDTVLKIDVEGFEAEVLRGATGLLSDPALLALVVETQGYESRYGQAGAVREVLQGTDFLPVRVDPLTRSLEPAEFSADHANTVLVRRARLEEVRARFRTAPVRRVLGYSIPRA